MAYAFARRISRPQRVGFALKERLSDRKIAIARIIGFDDLRRIAGHETMVGDSVAHHGAGTDDGVTADFDRRQNNRAGADHRAAADAHRSGDSGARADRDEIGDLDVMADARAAIDEGEAPMAVAPPTTTPALI